MTDTGDQTAFVDISPCPAKTRMTNRSKPRRNFWVVGALLAAIPTASSACPDCVDTGHGPGGVQDQIGLTGAPPFNAGPSVFEIGDTPPRALSQGTDEPPPVVQIGGPKADVIEGTRGADDMSGGAGKDIYFFRLNPGGANDQGSTLGEGDRIRDYESGEEISIDGVRFGTDDVRITYDPERNETRLDIDLADNSTGQKDGVADATLVLDGDQRGNVRAESNCCSVPNTTITIRVAPPAPAPQPRTDTAPPPK